MKHLIVLAVALSVSVAVSAQRYFASEFVVGTSTWLYSHSEEGFADIGAREWVYSQRLNGVVRLSKRWFWGLDGIVSRVGVRDYLNSPYEWETRTMFGAIVQYAVVETKRARLLAETGFFKGNYYEGSDTAWPHFSETVPNLSYLDLGAKFHWRIKGRCFLELGFNGYPILNGGKGAWAVGQLSAGLNFRI